MSYSRNYHKNQITKGTLGEISKVWEEYYELVDAIEQHVNIMCLCELCDLVGAVDEYIFQYTNIVIPPIKNHNHYLLSIDHIMNDIKNIIRDLEVIVEANIVDEELLHEKCKRFHLCIASLTSVFSPTIADVFDMVKKTKEACEN